MAVTSPEVAPKLDGSVAAIFDPQRLDRFEVSSEILFFPDSARPPGKESKIESIYMERIVLGYGVNMIKQSLLDMAKKHPATKKRLDELTRTGALRFIAPDAEVIMGCSCDFTKESEAIDVVRFTFNPEWLRLSDSRETRPQVHKAVRSRREEVENRIKKAPSAISDMSGFSLI